MGREPGTGSESPPARVVLLVGDSGSGKSRILHELEGRPPASLNALYVPVPTLRFHDLATWCLVSLGRTADGDPAEIFADEISRIAGGVLLLIDDADDLPLDTASRLAEIAAANDGNLVIVAAACPGARELELGKRLGAEHRIQLTQPKGALLHLREVHDLLLGAGTRAPMARIGIDRSPSDLESQSQDADRRDESSAPAVAILDEFDDLNESLPPELDAWAHEPEEALDVPPPREVLPPPSRPPEIAFSWAKPVALTLAAILLLAGAYELGRRSVTTAPAPDPLHRSASTARDPLPSATAQPPRAPAAPLAAVSAPPPAARESVERRELPAPPARDGWIEVEVDREGPALVWIDGASAGTTPVAGVAAAPGTHRVTLRLQNGEWLRRSVDVRPGRGTLVRFRPD